MSSSVTFSKMREAEANKMKQLAKDIDHAINGHGMKKMFTVVHLTGVKSIVVTGTEFSKGYFETITALAGNYTFRLVPAAYSDSPKIEMHIFI